MRELTFIFSHQRGLIEQPSAKNEQQRPKTGKNRRFLFLIYSKKNWKLFEKKGSFVKSETRFVFKIRVRGAGISEIPAAKIQKGWNDGGHWPATSGNVQLCFFTIFRLFSRFKTISFWTFQFLIFSEILEARKNGLGACENCYYYSASFCRILRII